MKLLTLLLLVGCGDNSLPRTISVTGDQDLGKQAVETWSKLGFTYVPKGGDLNITLKREVYIRDGSKTLGHAYDTTVTIDPDLVGVAVQHVAAHEFGHILLQTNDHLPPNEIGIMEPSPYHNGTPDWILMPTPDDYALACRTIEVCVN